MLGLKSKNTWFKFSIYIPENSEFTIPISNTIWQIHSKAIKRWRFTMDRFCKS